MILNKFMSFNYCNKHFITNVYVGLRKKNTVTQFKCAYYCLDQASFMIRDLTFLSKFKKMINLKKKKMHHLYYHKHIFCDKKSLQYVQFQYAILLPKHNYLTRFSFF